MRCVHLLLVALLLAPSGARAAAPKTAEEIRACVAANTPEVTHVQVVQLTATDRVGNERLTRAHVYGRRDENGLRRVLVRFTEPPELVGSAFLFIEREDATELVVRSPDLDSLKQASGCVRSRNMTAWKGSVVAQNATETNHRVRLSTSSQVAASAMVNEGRRVTSRIHRIRCGSVARSKSSCPNRETRKGLRTCSVRT